jgi:MraZ protein
MALFTGRHENKIDKKGRVSLPADFRAELPSDPSTSGRGRVVYIFPSPRSEALIAVDRDYIQNLSDQIEAEYDMFSDEEEDFSAVILADAQKISIDGDGRIVLPPDFVAFADIEDRALFVGGGSRFQIWRPSAYEAHADTTRARARSRTLPRRQRSSNPTGANSNRDGSHD